MKNKWLNIIGIIAVLAAVFFAIKGNKMIKPGNDFYDYATLEWRRAHPIPDDYSRYGVFDDLRETNLARVREIAETDGGKIGALYAIAMDADRLNSDGVKPVQKLLDDVDAIKSVADLPAYLGGAHRHIAAFWSDGVALDEMDSEFYIYNMGQGGIGMARDYYFDDDEKSVQIREKYKQYIRDMAQNFNIDSDGVYDLELRMAKSFFEKEMLRDPHANYHKMSYEKFREKFAGFDWDAYFGARGANPADINVNQIEPISESLEIISDTDLGIIKNYLKFRIASGASGVLDDKTFDTAFDFYNRTMAGQPSPKPRWKRSVSMIDGALGELVGQLYVEKYFPAAARDRMEKLVENLRRAYAMRIENLDWMSDDTKKKASEKLAAFHAKIGFPDVWRDYSKLEIRDGDSLFDNMMRVNEFEDKFWLDKIGQRRDPSIWYMNAHEVNAYYDPSTNEICFPAGILQYPFFDMDRDDTFNYGAIGSVIGHEMTHGFDDQGRKFDANGNLRDWWTDADAAAFDERAAVMRKFFDNIEVAPTVYANGEFTLGENLADYGGIMISFTAYREFGTAGDDMDFFKAYAMTEAGNIRDAEILRLTKMDVHSLSRWRVNGILPHIGAWYDVFGITVDDGMYLAPDARVKIW